MLNTISNLRMLPLLVLAGRFAEPEGDGGDGGGGGADKGGDNAGDKSKDKGADKSKDGAGGDAGDDGDGDGDKKTPIPYSRFAEVNTARRTAEKALATANTEVTRLSRENDQLRSKDQTGALTAAQEQLKAVEKQLEEVDAEFEDMLEVALAPLPKGQADIVRDIPGGARKQFAWFNKHRAALVGGDDTPQGDDKGVKGPKNEKKPGSEKEPKASAAAQSFVTSQKPAGKTGFPGLV